MDAIVNILIVLIIYTILFFIIESIKRFFNIRPEITRKAAHVTGGIFALIFYSFLSLEEFIISSGIITLFFAFSYTHRIMSSIHLESRKTYGEIIFPVALIAVAIFFYQFPYIFISAILTLTISDTLADLLGDKKPGKSRRGSIVFFISTLIILVIISIQHSVNITFYSFIVLTITSLGATLAERVATKGWDNITIPLTASLLLSIFL